jgi:hypothetical protein
VAITLFQINEKGQKRPILVDGSIRGCVNRLYRGIAIQEKNGNRKVGFSKRYKIVFQNSLYLKDLLLSPREFDAETMMDYIHNYMALKFYPSLVIGSLYSKNDLQEALNEPTLVDSAKWSPGVYYCKDKPITILFVDLDKSEKEERFKFNDYFDGNQFHWDSQPKQHIDVPSIQHIVAGLRTPLLFVRTHRQIKGITQPFVYCGRLEYLSHDETTRNPVHIVFESLDYSEDPNSELAQVYNWSKMVNPDLLARKLNATPIKTEPSVVHKPDNSNSNPIVNENQTVELLPEGPSEKLILQKIRTQQGAFRRALIEKYNSTCCLSGNQDPRLLIASHIKPFAECTEVERQDVNNGLLLSVHIDALFDKGLISFYNDGTIIISQALGRKTQSIFNIKAGAKLTTPLNDVQKVFMQYHRSKLLK